MPKLGGLRRGDGRSGAPLHAPYTVQRQPQPRMSKKAQPLIECSSYAAGFMEKPDDLS